MISNFKRGENGVMRFSFESLDEYLDYLAKAPAQPIFGSVRASVQGDADFTGTESLDEAIELCRYGYHEGFERLARFITKVNGSLDMAIDKPRTFHSFVGFAPDVKAYLEGSPLSMIDKPPRPRKHIVVYLNTSYKRFTSPDAIFNRGGITLAALEALEMLGYTVDLHLFEMSYCEDDDGHREVHLSEFMLKRPDERVNIQKLYFPLCHPSWIRRLNFRLIETTPGIDHRWAATYGSPAEADLIRQVIDIGDGDILIPTIEEIGIEGIDVLQDARRLFAIINNGLPAEDRLKLKEA